MLAFTHGVVVRLLVVGVVGGMINFPLSAFAKTHCGVEATYPDFEAGDFIASCSDRHNICRATILSATKNEILSIRRETGTDFWEITLGSNLVRMDSSRGLDYVVVPGGARHVAAKALRNLETVGIERSSAKNKILIKSMVAKTVLQDMLKGQVVKWIYEGPSGEVGEATFHLRGLIKVVAWIGCKQGKAEH